MVQIGDSAYPLAAGTYPSSVVGWGFYIGGDTPHVWSDAEVAALPYPYRLPIYTRSDPSGTAQAQSDADAAVSWARAHGQPTGTLIQLDFESAVDAAYVGAFDAVITAAGYKTVLYGSQSSVLQNPQPSGGYNVADWDGVDDDPSWTAKQYEDTGDYDLNDFSPSAPLWNTQAPAVAPQGDDDMIIIYVEGTTSVYGLSGSLLWGIADPTSLAAYQAAGVPQVHSITASELTRLQGAANALVPAANASVANTPVVPVMPVVPVASAQVSDGATSG